MDNKLYTGFSSNLRKRLTEHNSGGVDSTRNRRPLELIYYEAHKYKDDALAREKFLKTTRGKILLKKQITLKRDD